VKKKKGILDSRDEQVEDRPKSRDKSMCDLTCKI